MSTGDEWKEGTPYEDPEDRAMRSLRELARHLAEATRRMAEAAGELGSALTRTAIPQMISDATLQIVQKTDRDPKDVEAEIRTVVLIASAEGRPVATALKDHIASKTEQP